MSNTISGITTDTQKTISGIVNTYSDNNTSSSTDCDTLAVSTSIQDNGTLNVVGLSTLANVTITGILTILTSIITFTNITVTNLGTFFNITVTGLSSLFNLTHCYRCYESFNYNLYKFNGYISNYFR